MATTHTATTHDQHKSPVETRQTPQGQTSGQRQPEHGAESSPSLQRYLGNSYMQSLSVTQSASSQESALPSIVQEVVRSPGQPLDPTTRTFMESRFDADFSQVRVHSDGQAVASARALRSSAYTVGRDIVFGAGQFAPHTAQGQRLLAHELTHIVQQEQSASSPHCLVSSPADTAEVEADRISASILTSSENPTAVKVSAQRTATVQRQASLDKLVPPPPLPDWTLKEFSPEKPSAPTFRFGQSTWRRGKLVTVETLRDWAREEVEKGESFAGLVPRLLSSHGEFADGSPEEIQRWVSVLRSWELELRATQQQVQRERAERYAREAKEREILKTPFEKRLRAARVRLQQNSDYWYSWKEAVSRMSADDVWFEGFNNGLFLEREKRAVYEAHNSVQEFVREEQEEAAKLLRRKAEIEQYNRHVARGKQLSSPAPILQPFAFAALSPLVGAAYAGAQTGVLVGEAYNACARGTGGECAAAIAKGGVAVAVSRATRGKPQTPPPLPSPTPTAKPGLEITRPATLDPQTGKIKVSGVETASGRHFDAEVDPQTGLGQIVDRASGQVVGIIRNGEVSPPAANSLPSAKSTPPAPPPAPTLTVHQGGGQGSGQQTGMLRGTDAPSRGVQVSASHPILKDRLPANDAPPGKTPQVAQAPLAATGTEGSVSPVIIKSSDPSGSRIVATSGERGTPGQEVPIVGSVQPSNTPAPPPPRGPSAPPPRGEFNDGPTDPDARPFGASQGQDRPVHPNVIRSPRQVPPSRLSPIRFGRDEDGYIPDGIFRKWIPHEIPSEGWKLHVSASPGTSLQGAQLVLPKLREMGVAHKVVESPVALATHMTGTQVGKFITIYPRNNAEARATVSALDPLLSGRRLSGPEISGERSLGSSGLIYTRYGGFTKRTVTDPSGREVPDFRGTDRPPWIPDPWGGGGSQTP